MRPATVALWLACWCCPFALAWERNDSLRYATETVEIVKADETRRERFKNDPAYDYYKKKLQVEESENWIQKALRKVFEWWFEKGSDTSAGSTSGRIYLIAGLLLLAGMAFLTYLYKPSLFFRNKSKDDDYRVDDDSLHGWDFDLLIANALRDGEYNHAIRWRYLQVLSALEERELISWRPNKTVIEYSYELKESEIKQPFKELSWLFLCFRYGNFQASEPHYDETNGLATQILRFLKP